ncbi:hypothetical protein ACP70R_027286 [Stipagrostis hirtigluma subsp. patula]
MPQEIGRGTDGSRDEQPLIAESQAQNEVDMPQEIATGSDRRGHEQPLIAESAAENESK